MKKLFLLFFLLVSAPLRAQAHSASLSWGPSIDAGVTYNVYRMSGACPATQPVNTTGFTKINTTAITTLTYTDTTVTAGSYCFIVTAVLNSTESVPSNTVFGRILPSPPPSLIITSLN